MARFGWCGMIWTRGLGEWFDRGVVVLFCLGWGLVVLADGLVLGWLRRGCVAVCVLVPSRPPYKVNSHQDTPGRAHTTVTGGEPAVRFRRTQRARHTPKSSPPV